MEVLAAKTNLLAVAWERVRHSAMLYGALATAVRVGANIMLLPLVLKLLTSAELAIWWVFLTLGMVANLADFGFSQVITRIYSFLWAGADDFDVEGLRPAPENGQPNLPRIRQFHAAAARLYLWIACIGMLLLVLVGTFFIVGPASASGNPAMIWICWAGFILAIGLSLSTSRWPVACQGINQMRQLQIAQLGSSLVYLFSAAAFLLAGWGLFAMVAATVLRAIVSREFCRRTYLAAVGAEASVDTGQLQRIMRRIWPNAQKFGGIMIATFMVFHANTLICSHFLGTAVTASYGLTVQLGGFIMSFSGLWLTVKWPQITIMRTQGRLEDMAILFARRLALTMLTFLVLAAGLVLFGNTVLDWKGTHTKFLETPYLVVYLLQAAQQHFYAQFGSLAFTENVVPFVKLSLWTGAALIVLTIVLVQYMGLWGLLLGPIISTVAASSWYITRRGFQGQPLSVKQFARAALFGHV
jgi:O-antigen/teichoic acid export membrane protein